MSLSIGDPAPNFDLASTEDCVLMLWDEVPRKAVVLYFFADPGSERERRDLAELDRARRRLADRPLEVLGISPAKLDALKRAQRELALSFPLLHDDRGFSRYYGVEAGADGSAPPAALFLIDHRQRVGWLANPVGGIEEAMAQMGRALAELPSPAAQYPRKVVNRWVDRWVN